MQQRNLYITEMGIDLLRDLGGTTVFGERFDGRFSVKFWSDLRLQIIVKFTQCAKLAEWLQSKSMFKKTSTI